MKLEYIIFLQNVDDSIKELKLIHDLHVVSLDQNTTIELIKGLENCSTFEASKKITIEGKVSNYDTKRNNLIAGGFYAELDEQSIKQKESDLTEPEAIVKEVWHRLKETHKLRVVK